METHRTRRYGRPIASNGLSDLNLTTDVAMAPGYVSGHFNDPDGDTFTFALASGSAALPAGLCLSGAGILSGTPTAAETAASIIIRASDGFLTADSGFSLTVSTISLPFSLTNFALHTDRDINGLTVSVFRLRLSHRLNWPDAQNRQRTQADISLPKIVQVILWG